MEVNNISTIHSDFELIKNKLKSPLIFDGRSQYNVETMKKYGFDYICVGRKPE